MNMWSGFYVTAGRRREGVCAWQAQCLGVRWNSIWNTTLDSQLVPALHTLLHYHKAICKTSNWPRTKHCNIVFPFCNPHGHWQHSTRGARFLKIIPLNKVHHQLYPPIPAIVSLSANLRILLHQSKPHRQNESYGGAERTQALPYLQHDVS